MLTLHVGCYVLQIDFEQDNIVSQENEYEILQLMMGDLRDKWVPGGGWCLYSAADSLCPAKTASLSF